MSKSPDELKKHTLFLREGDFERLRVFFPDIAPSIVVRKIISGYVDKLEGERKSPTVSVDI